MPGRDWWWLYCDMALCRAILSASPTQIAWCQQWPWIAALLETIRGRPSSFCTSGAWHNYWSHSATLCWNVCALHFYRGHIFPIWKTLSFLTCPSIMCFLSAPLTERGKTDEKEDGKSQHSAKTTQSVRCSSWHSFFSTLLGGPFLSTVLGWVSRFSGWLPCLPHLLQPT